MYDIAGKGWEEERTGIRAFHLRMDRNSAKTALLNQYFAQP